MRALSIHQKVKIRKKNEHARYTVEYFPVDNARVIYTKRSKFVKNEHARYTLGVRYLYIKRDVEKVWGARRYLPENTVIAMTVYNKKR
jgi:hypothetical protein